MELLRITRQIGAYMFKSVVEYLNMNLLQIYYRVCYWKNFENRIIVGEVMAKSSVSCFFWLTVYATRFYDVDSYKYAATEKMKHCLKYFTSQ